MSWTITGVCCASHLDAVIAAITWIVRILLPESYRMPRNVVSLDATTKTARCSGLEILKTVVPWGRTALEGAVQPTAMKLAFSAIFYDWLFRLARNRQIIFEKVPQN